MKRISKMNMINLVMMLSMIVALSSCKKQTSETLTKNQEINDLTRGTNATPYSITINNTGNIQSALNQCEANGGGTVYLHSGWYYVDTTVFIPNHCTLRSVATESVPIIRMRDGKDCPIIAN